MVVTALGLLLGNRADSSASVPAAARPPSKDTGRCRKPARSSTGCGMPAATSTRSAATARPNCCSPARSPKRDAAAPRSAVGRRPAGVLTELGEQLVVVHGQSDQLRLRSAVGATAKPSTVSPAPSSQSALQDYQTVYRRWQAGQSRARRARHRAREPRPRGRTAADRHRARSRPSLQAAVRTSRSASRPSDSPTSKTCEWPPSRRTTACPPTSADDGRDAIALVEDARRALDRVCGARPGAGRRSPRRWPTASFQLSDVAVQLSSYLAMDSTPTPARELETVQDRRAELATLVRKYGPTLDDVIDYLRHRQRPAARARQRRRSDRHAARRGGRRPRTAGAARCADCARRMRRGRASCSPRSPRSSPRWRCQTRGWWSR